MRTLIICLMMMISQTASADCWSKLGGGVRPKWAEGMSDALVVQAFVESNFNAEAISSAGAIGLLQIMPATAKELASELGWKKFSVAMLFDPRKNIKLSQLYRKKLLTTFKNNEILMLIAYNAGPKRAWTFKRNQKLPRETSSYVTKNLYFQELCR